MTDAEIVAAFAKKRKRVCAGRHTARHKWPRPLYKSVPVPNPMTVLKRAERELLRAEKTIAAARRKAVAAELHALKVADATHEAKHLPNLHDAMVSWRWAENEYESALKSLSDAVRAVGRAKATLTRWRAK